MDDRPWWWLDENERARLGLGAAVQRSSLGVVFGDTDRVVRLEILPRTDDAPIRLGPISMRLWGDPRDPRARTLLRGAVEILGPRLADDFDPHTVAIESALMAASPKGETRTTIIDVPSVCDRACVFCQVSLRPIETRSPRGTDAEVEHAIAVAEGAVLFTGDDALSNPRIVEWVDLAARKASHVAVIGPPRLGRTAALAPALAKAGMRKYVTALLGASEATHDRVGGREGAHRAVREAAAAMRAAGITVELVTPLIRPVLSELGAIADLAATLADGGHTLLAYAPDSMVGDAFDPVVPAFDDLREALTAITGKRSSVDALPLCVLPAAMRSNGGTTLERTDERLGVVYPEAICGACELRARCPGLAVTVERAVGTRGLVALRRSAARP